ncbi:MAG: VOC family protein [Alphaproteobacteria bacterium]|nr:VOC family protein [Alphaproteobacteria bacterium]MBE8220175.1 VOC family protein [Alphaproteobacteria bacterium]
MLGYATIGTNDRERANAFYDEIFGLLGAKRLFNNERTIYWGTDMSSGMIGVGSPSDGGTPSAGNGAMLALAAGSHEMVDKIYAKALELGASDEGAPGDRGSGFYGAYFRDQDGNKLVAFSMG